MSVSGLAKALIARFDSGCTSDLIWEWWSDEYPVLNQVVMHLKILEIVSRDVKMKLIENEYEVNKCLNEAKSAISYAEQLEDCILNNWGSLSDLEFKNRRKAMKKNMSQIPAKLQSSIDNLKGVLELKLLTFVLAEGESRRLRDLKEVNDMNGTLFIYDLKYVNDVDDVNIASLKTKEYLEELVLDWGKYKQRGELSDEKVLDALQAHTDLKRLTIEGYVGKMLSNWIVGVAPSFTKLASLSISDCCNCESLPSLGNLPYLKNLIIKYLPRLKLLDAEFYGGGCNPFNALEKMEIESMNMLETWSFPDREGFSSLKELRVVSCGNLEMLPYCFPSLSVLCVQRCKKLVDIDMRGAVAGFDKRQYGHSLQSIILDYCDHLKSIPESFVNLAIVNMSDCMRLVSVPRLEHVVKLKYTPNVPHFKRGFMSFLLDLISINHLDLLIPYPDIVVEVLPPHLSHLVIRGYTWNISELALGSIKSLTTLELYGDKYQSTYRQFNEFYTPLGSLKCLTNLEFHKYDTCKTFTLMEFPLTLKHLTIGSCADLRNISDGVVQWCREMHVQLQVTNCPRFECLTTSLSTLKTLKLVNCPLVQLCPTGSSTEIHYLASLTAEKHFLLCGDTYDSSEGRKQAYESFYERKWDDTFLLTDLMRQLYHVEALSNMEGIYAIFDAENLLQLLYMDLPQSNKMVDSAESSSSTSKIHNFKWKDIVHTIHSYKEIRRYPLMRVINRLRSVAYGLESRLSERILSDHHLAANDNFELEADDELILYTNEGFSANLANHTFSSRSKENVKLRKLLNLRNCNEDKLLVIPIFGISGVGKTTLASVVYNDCTNSDGSEIFEVKGWACVSDMHQENHIIKSLLRSINGQESELDNDLDLLQRELKERLQGKRYLLVLDDICIDTRHTHSLESLRKPFLVGAPGSRIIITTHSRDAADIVSTSAKFIYELAGLSEGDSWSLFKGITFPDGDPNDYPELKEIGRKIVRICKGFPLDVKMIGVLLRSKGVVKKEWKNVLHSLALDLESINSITKPLWLSYWHLPQSVQRCFMYFSLFPKGYSFTMEEMVMLWVAEDFEVIQSSGSKGCEDVARKNFNILCSHFFLQPGNLGFVMHDLVHDLAVRMSRELVVDSQNVKKESRWLCYHRNQDEIMLIPESLRELNDLQAFFSIGGSEAESGLYFNPRVLNDLLSNFKQLRVLSLQGYAISELPGPVVEMQHLRCLNLSGTNIKCLPEKICSLVELQILHLLNCRKLQSLPANIRNLVKLRHLDVEGTQLKEMPDGIGCMKSLQTLPIFVLNKGKSKQMREFKELIGLHGKLYISRLDNVSATKKEPLDNVVDDKENVDIAEDVETAEFGNKKYLEELILGWDSSKYRSTKLDDKVLDAIKPHVNLKRLTIKWYGGKKLSDWIVGVTNLVSLRISDCFRCVVLQSLGDLQTLKDLNIEGLDWLQVLDSQFYGTSDNPFPALEKLKISRMGALTGWDPPQGGFKLLKELQIESCKVLKEIPYCFPCLTRLEISNCYYLVELNMSGPAEECGESLKYIDLKGCPKLREIPERFVNLAEVIVEVCFKLVSMPKLQSVRKLSLQYVGDTLDVKELIKSCKNRLLKELAIWLSSNVAAMLLGAKYALLKPLTSVKRLELEIENDAEINDDVTLPPNVSNILIRGGNFEIQGRILANLSDLKSLTHLEFFECHALASFPEVALPSTIISLRIALCDGLTTITNKFLEDCSKRLEELEIFYCGELECLPSRLLNLDSLRTLSLNGCPLIKEFPPSSSPHDLANLSYLWISNCSNFEVLPERHTIAGLRNLGISACPNLVLPKNGFPANLRHLTIIDSDKLQPVSSMELRELTRLTSLHLEGFKETTTLDGCLPVSIEDLTIRNFPLLQSLSEVLPSLQKLRRFEVECCPGVVL